MADFINKPFLNQQLADTAGYDHYLDEVLPPQQQQIIFRPDFERIPSVLKRIAAWVTWRRDGSKKVPYQAESPNKRARSTDRSTWSSFEAAKVSFEAGGFDGVGIVLDGSGLVGVDLDDCVVDGLTSPAALEFVDRIGLGYVEYSPSGTGLRGFGYFAGARSCRGHVGTLSVEIYFDKRYLTVTGKVSRDGPIQDLRNLNEVLQEIRAVPVQKRTEELESGSSVSSLSSVSSVSLQGIPEAAIPTGPGERNRCLFSLARHLKGLNPEADVHSMYPAVQHWHQQYGSVIETKELEVSWADFVYSWDRILTLPGEVLGPLIADLPTPPSHLIRVGYGPLTVRLVAICMRLQQHEGRQPFFLSCRTASKLLEIKHACAAAAILRLLVRDKVLTVVTPGRMGKATRYRFVAPLSSTADGQDGHENSASAGMPPGDQVDYSHD
jgi:hypothetical protein